MLPTCHSHYHLSDDASIKGVSRAVYKEKGIQKQVVKRLLNNKKLKLKTHVLVTGTTVGKNSKMIVWNRKKDKNDREHAMRLI